MEVPSTSPMAQRLSSIAERLLPPSISRSGEYYLRGHLLLALLLLNITFCFLTIPVYLILIGFNSVLFPIAMAVDIICLAGYLLALYILIKRGNFALSAHITFGVLLAVNMLATQLSGGFIESPVPQLTLFTPIFAFVLFGMKRGIVWLAITVLLCLISLVLSHYGLLSYQFIPEQQTRQTLEIICFFVLIFMGTTGLVFYEWMYRDLQNKLKEERDSYVYQASHDMLTGLPNRFQFFEYFERTLARARRHKQSFALGYIDLDGFKPINDNFGHHTGDVILETIAQRLNDVIRGEDMVARFGGDEFTLLLPDITDRSAGDTVLKRINEVLAKPIVADEQTHRVTASIGVALFPGDGDSVDELCRNADIALYRAKKKNNTYCFYDEIAVPAQA